MITRGSAILRTTAGLRNRFSSGDGEPSISRALSLANIKRKASNSLSAVQDTYLSTKEVFENHRVVFTVGTSIASVLTAWAGYSLRQMHQASIEKRLGSIEESGLLDLGKKTKVQIREMAMDLDALLNSDGFAAYLWRVRGARPGQDDPEQTTQALWKLMKKKNNVEHEEIKKIVSSGNVSSAACVATALTSLVLGYGLGWRGGAWYANRKFQREQLKLLGQIKPNRWQILRRPFVRLRKLRSAKKSTGMQSSIAHPMIAEVQSSIGPPSLCSNPSSNLS